MKNTKSVALLLTGVALGTSLVSPAANAAAEFFQAQRTPHPICVDGKQEQMETYAIGGYNYVKLRHILRHLSTALKQTRPSSPVTSPQRSTTSSGKRC